MRTDTTRTCHRFLAVAVYALLAMQAPAGIHTRQTPRPAESALNQQAQANLSRDYGRLPSSFEPNTGQFDPPVRFVSRGRGYVLFLTNSEAVMVLSKRKARLQRPVQPDPQRLIDGKPGEMERAVVRMKLAGARPNPEVEGLDQLPGVSNYFIGKDPSRWRTNIPNYAKARLGSIYQGIDLVYYGNQGRLEYDFVVHPGADARQIELAFEGVDALRLDRSGDLVFQTALGEVRWQRPLVYQEKNGTRHPVEAAYAVRKLNRVSFEVARYDREAPLLIDPVFTYSTYLGGSNTEIAYSVAADSSGNAYVAGDTDSVDFPTTAGSYQPALRGGTDAFVAKLNASGSALLFSTYLGGSTGLDTARGIAVDASGCSYIAGWTWSSDFPTTAGVLQPNYAGGAAGEEAYEFQKGDAFVTKLGPAGSSLIFSTYLGGSGGDQAAAIAVDWLGNAWVGGFTMSSNFPTTSDAFRRTWHAEASDVPGNSFVSKLNGSGSALLYSSYIGAASYETWVSGIAVDSSGNAYLTGKTGIGGNDLPNPAPSILVVNAFQPVKGGGYWDAYVMKLAPGGSIIYSTYLGGSGDDYGQGIAADALGNAYITGYTSSINFPLANPLQPTNAGRYDAFVTKLNSTGSALVYSTFLGGPGVTSAFESGWDIGRSIAVDADGSAWVTGWTTSLAFPTVDPLQWQNAYNPGNNCYSDAFLAQLNPAGSALSFSTYLGGRCQDYGYGVALDGAGSVYVTGNTNSTDFPTRSPYQATIHVPGTTDAFVTKLLINGPAPTAPSLPSPADLATGVGLTPSLTWTGDVNATSYDVYFGTAQSPPLVANVTSIGHSPAALTPGTTYYWKIVAKNVAGSTPGAIWSFVTASLPAAPSAPSPANGATAVGLTPSLTWTGSANAASYDVYFGTAQSPPLVTNVTGIGYSPAALTPGTTYYWKIVAKNAAGSTPGAVWSFVTLSLPAAPALLSPANTTLGVALTPSLTWTGDANATSYDVYLTSIAGDVVANVTSTAYTPASLMATTTYYWHVVAKNAAGSTRSPDWWFATGSLPAAPVDPSPANAATGVGLTPSLTWTGDANAASYDVYFGTAQSPPLVTNVTSIGYSPAALMAGTTYYWKIVAKNAVGSKPGAVWSFVTASLPAAPSAPSPANGATPVGLTPSLTWTGSSNATSYDVYFGTAQSPPLITNVTSTSYSPAPLTTGATYYWKIVAKNAAGSTPGAVWSFVTVSLPAVLSVTKTHSASLTQGEVGAPYSVVVSNAAGEGPTSGTVTVTENVPTGLTLVSMSGTGWSCSGATCTRSDALAGSATYPAITVTVNVAANATSPQVNAVGVSGGGSASAGITDSTVVLPLHPLKIGTYNAGLWTLDANANGVFDAGVDKSFTWGSAGTMPVHGDWNGDGKQKAGFFFNGLWYLDYDGNGIWDNGAVDKAYGFGMAGVQPVVGDWNGDGKDEIGIYINGFWFLDMNGNGVWDGPSTDKMIIWGWSGVTPVIGDWNGDGRKKVGVFYNGLWYLDYDGNGTWDNGVVDKVYGFGMSGVQAMVGDWNGDGKDEIGIYIGGFWFLDMNGNGVWDGETTDRMTILGWTGTTPVIGDWNGDGKTKVGTFLNGYWYLDYNGNGIWDGETTDKAYVFGQAGDTPIVGRW